MWSAEGFELDIVLALPVPQARLEAPGTRGLVAGLLAQAGLAPARLVLRGSVDGACCEVADLLDWLRARGVEVVNLDSAECKALMAEFITRCPEIWNEDIGEE